MISDCEDCPLGKLKIKSNLSIMIGNFTYQTLIESMTLKNCYEMLLPLEITC